MRIDIFLKAGQNVRGSLHHRTAKNDYFRIVCMNECHRENRPDAPAMIENGQGRFIPAIGRREEFRKSSPGPTVGFPCGARGMALPNLVKKYG